MQGRDQSGSLDARDAVERGCALLPHRGTSAHPAPDYMQHPKAIPLHYRHIESHSCRQVHIPQFGGLRFHAKQPVLTGTTLEIVIVACGEQHRFRGLVAWVWESNRNYEIGFAFSSRADAFRGRMVEQACHIEAYQHLVMEREGREISLERAAREWIGKFSAEFARAYG